jgi:peroxiredoxin
MGTLKQGDEAPAFTLTEMKGGKHVSLEALARGSLLVVFFKVSCPTCQYTLPFLERMHQQLGGHGAQIWGISQDNAGNSQDFAREFGISFPILIDDHPYEISDAFGITHVPTLFLVGAQGRIELTTDGFDKKDLLAIQHSLAQHATVSPPALFLPSERVPESKPG